MVRDIARFVTLGGIFLLPFLPLIVADSLFFPFITGKNFLFRIVVEIIFASWVILACYDVKYRPRFSYILVAVLSLLGIMALADALGVAPQKSFWSNYERMEGYVTLAHLGLYFLVAGSVLARERLWNVFWNVSLVVATFMMLYGFCQLSGNESCPISQSDFRIDGRMGNAAYLAIYMLFHVFMSLILLVRTQSRHLRIVYGVLSAGFIFTLMETGTRGTALALAGGAVVAAVYIALFERKNKLVRKVAIGAVALVILVAGGLYAAKDSAFVTSNDNLRRIASVTLEQGETRFTIWSLAWEGFKERPLLGWGQENFNYVFNAHYKASLYQQEPWFDRVHNIIFDWLIAGGILGLLAYLSITLTALYYVVVRPRSSTESPAMTVAERGLLLGLFAGYFAHNLLVFDNLISYFFFMSVVAMLHGEFAHGEGALSRLKLKPIHVTQVITPAVLVLMVLAVYFINIPGIKTAGLIIDAFNMPTPEERLATFEEALAQGSFANQEVREQLARVAQEVANDATLPAQYQRALSLPQEEALARATAVRAAYATRAEAELFAQLEETPDDIRIMTFLSSFYRATGRPEDAVVVAEEAITRSPQRQQLYFERAFALAQAGRFADAQQGFKEAFELEPSNGQARMFYAASTLMTDDHALFSELVTPAYEDAYIANEYLLRIAYGRKRYDIAIDILERRIVRNPADLQLRVSLAFMRFESGDRLTAVKVLGLAIQDFPSFKTEGEKYIQQIMAAPVGG